MNMIWFASFVLFTATLSQSAGGDFELTGQTLDAGGGEATNAAFSLIGSVAQPDADRHTATGDGFRLSGGFWGGSGELIFTDGFEGGSP